MFVAEPEVEKWEFDCGFSDVVCKSSEGIANGVADMLRWALDMSLGKQGFVPGDTLWVAATGEAGQWFGIVIIVMLMATVVAISIAALRGDVKGLKRALLGMLTSIAATMFAVFALGKGLEVVDAMSDGILDRLTHGEQGFKALLAEGLVPSSSDKVGQTAVAVSYLTQPTVVIVVMIIFVLGLLIMTVALAFRNFILMILIAFAPLAFMILPHKGGEVWVKRWAAAVVAMLIAKPLIFGTLAMLVSALGDVSLWGGEGITLAIGIIISGFMPLIAFSFFSFLGGSGAQIAGDQVGSQVGQKVTSQATNTTRMLASKGAAAGGRGGGSAGGSQAAMVPVPQTPATHGTTQTPSASGGAGAGATAVQTPSQSEPQSRSAATPQQHSGGSVRPVGNVPQQRRAPVNIPAPPVPSPQVQAPPVAPQDPSRRQ